MAHDAVPAQAAWRTTVGTPSGPVAEAGPWQGAGHWGARGPVAGVAPYESILTPSSKVKMYRYTHSSCARISSLLVPGGSMGDDHCEERRARATLSTHTPSPWPAHRRAARHPSTARLATRPWPVAG